MMIVPLYKTTREDGGISVSPNKTGELHGYRLIASDGMLLKKGDVVTTCIDTDSDDGWEEIVDTENPEEVKE